MNWKINEIKRIRNSSGIIQELKNENKKLLNDHQNEISKLENKKCQT